MMLEITDSSVARLVDAVAAYGLGDQKEAIEAATATWSESLDSLRRGRLLGLAMAAADDGQLVMTDQQFDDLAMAHKESMVWSLVMERTLLEMTESLYRQGVRAVVLKGSALAHTAYPNPSWRPFGDVDLLVRREDWRLACAVLAEQGARRRLPEPRPDFDVRFAKAISHVMPDGREIDLHRTLAEGPFGQWIDAEELRSRVGSWELGGRTLERLDDTATFAHACVHAVLGFETPMPITLRDVAQTGGRDIDWQDLRRWAVEWRLGPVFALAMRQARERLGYQWNDDAAALMSATYGRRETHALEAYTTARRRRGGMALATLSSIDGLPAKASYARALFLPSRAFMDARGAVYGSGYTHRLLSIRRWFGSSPSPSGTVISGTGAKGQGEVR